jgi:8-oxo-dGTP diphosphatase
LGDELASSGPENTTVAWTQTQLYVVRHADAGIRGHDPDDHLRPLSHSGQAQARTLADLLERASIGVIVSSPYVRCVQTVEPLAARRRGKVALSAALAEGAALGPMLRLLQRLPDGSVACTHGDMLGELAGVFADARYGHVEPISFDKGVVWVLLRNGRGLSLIDQVPAPPTSIGHPCGRIFREKRVSAGGHDHSIQLPRRSAEDGQQKPIEEEQEAAFG